MRVDDPSAEAMVHWEGGLNSRVETVLKINVGNIADDGLEE